MYFVHDFECERLQERDANGRLVATGVRWTEHKPHLEPLGGLILTIGMLLFLALVCTGLFMLTPHAKVSRHALALFGVLLWGVVMVGTYFGVARKGIERRLIFHWDGRVLVPNGIVYHRKVRELSLPHETTASIEARVVSELFEHKHGVALYRRGGDIVYLAEMLHPDAAHKVAVQLTLALAELRESLADVARLRPAPQAAPKPSTTRAMTVIE